MAEESATVTQPPIHQQETGIAMAGNYPLNHRLRAEALVADGKETDPDKMVDDATIADTKARLQAEQDEAKAKAEADAAASRELHAMKKDDLISTAEQEGVQHDPSAPKADIVQAIEQSRAADPAVHSEGQ